MGASANLGHYHDCGFLELGLAQRIKGRLRDEKRGHFVYSVLYSTYKGARTYRGRMQ